MFRRSSGNWKRRTVHDPTAEQIRHVVLLEEGSGEVALFNGHRAQQTLLVRLLQDVLFDCAGAYQPVYVDIPGGITDVFEMF